MKDLKNLKGAKVLGKLEQRTITGGYDFPVLCIDDGDCRTGQECVENVCLWSIGPILP